MLSLKMAAVALAVGVAAMGCGGPEDMEAQEKAGLPAPTREQLVKPRLDVIPATMGERSAQVYNYSRHRVVYICLTQNGQEYCEDVSNTDESLYDWAGTVGIYTFETNGNGSYFATFAGSSVSWDFTIPVWSGGVLAGMWRHYTLTGVTAGIFFSQIQGSDSVFYHDQVELF